MFTNAWSFTDERTQTVVSGTLSGLQNGTGLSAYGLTATVTQAYFADLLGTYNIDSAGSAAGSYNTYSAANNLVNYASFQFSNGANSSLFFGTAPSGTTYYPQLINSSQSENLYNRSVGTSFSVSATAVPEPATLALLALPMGLAGLAAARKRRGASAGGIAVETPSSSWDATLA